MSHLHGIVLVATIVVGWFVIGLAAAGLWLWWQERKYR